MKITVLHAFCDWPAESELNSEDAWRNPFAERLAATCEERDIPFLDTTPALIEEAASGNSPYFYTDTHLNGDGHRVLADVLAPWIEGLVSKD